MVRSLAIAGLILLVGSICQAQKEGSSGGVQTVNASGCVSSGVEAGCLMLRSTKDNQLYNLFFKGNNKPRVDTAISFEGTKHEGPTTCMQGTPVDVAKWHPIRMHCPKGEREKK